MAFLYRYYMKPNLEFVQLDHNDEIALKQIMREYDACQKAGLLCAKHETSGNIPDKLEVHSHPGLFEQDAKAWLYRMTLLNKTNTTYTIVETRK
jgi:hypothetical protein